VNGPLPILLSIPHGGTETPPEVAQRVVASPADVFEDGDSFTREIYHLGDRVAAVQSARIARAFVDLNRSEDDRPPANPDGVVKSATCFDRALYSEPLDDPAIERLLALYHRPYHASLENSARSAGAVLALDCHSMAAMPPPVAPDAGRPRPLFCLSNGEGRTCDDSLLAGLAARLAAAFECPAEEVLLNRPFKGGYITRRHGRNPLPWIQVEMNRVLYLADPWFDPRERRVDPERLLELRERFWTALTGLDLGVLRSPASG
jgi:N-formylglutamate deformylase